jgi:hypothetical protein
MSDLIESALQVSIILLVSLIAAANGSRPDGRQRAVHRCAMVDMLSRTLQLLESGGFSVTRSSSEPVACAWQAGPRYSTTTSLRSGFSMGGRM